MSSMLTSISMADVIDPQTAVLHIPKMIRQDEYGYRTSVDGKEVSPLTIIPLNQPFPISKAGGSASSSFVLKRFAEGYYVCSCPAWRFSTERNKMRKTCTHLKDVLGEQYENDRIALAKEAKSTVFEHSKFRRTTSDGHHARHTHAKSMLDDHFRQLSQSQTDDVPSTSANTAGPTCELSKTPIDGATHSRSTDETNTSDSAPRRTSVQQEQDDSDTETEEEDVVASQAAPSHRAVTLASTPVQPTTPTVAGNIRPAYDDDDNDEYGFDPDDVQTSPSKRARRGKKSAADSDDDKVSRWSRPLPRRRRILSNFVSFHYATRPLPGLPAAGQALAVGR